MKLRVGVGMIDRDDTAPCGVHRYAANVVQALVEGGHEVYLYTNPALQTDAYLPSHVRHSINVRLLARRLQSAPTAHVAHFVGLPWRAFQDRLDILHIVNARPAVATMPLVLTVHDVSELFMAFKYTFIRRMYRALVLYPYLRRQRVLATVSHSAKADLVAGLRIRPDRVVVTPNVVAPALTGRQPRATIAPTSLLYVGRIDHPSKNLLTLIQAFDLLAPHVPTAHLHLVGADSWNADVVKRAAAGAAAADRIHFHGWVSDDALATHISSAGALCLPSLREGFGLPAAEALRLGTPVLAAAAGALPELLGETSEGLVPPDDVRAWCRVMRRVTSEDGFREKLLVQQAEAYDAVWGQVSLLDTLAALYTRVRQDE